jgi:hypothetical protein
MIIFKLINHIQISSKMISIYAEILLKQYQKMDLSPIKDTWLLSENISKHNKNSKISIKQ